MRTLMRERGLVCAARCLLAISGLILLSACAGQRYAPAPATAGAEGYSYVIGPGDTLGITVWRNPELSTTVPVRPDGKISTPLVSDMVAVGKTSSQLAADIQEVLKTYVRTPNVSVIVTHSNGVFSQVRVVGQAVSPRAVPYRSGMTVLDLVIQVGGLSQFAAGNRAKIVRSEDGSTRELRVRLDDLMNKGRISENIALHPGDILVIPETRF